MRAKEKGDMVIAKKLAPTVRARTSPSISFLVVGSMPTVPEQYTIPLLFTAKQNGLGLSGSGALSVLTISLVGAIGSTMMDFEQERA